MVAPKVYFEKDPSATCYTGCRTGACWICLGGRIWIKRGDYFTIYFDVKNDSRSKAKVKIKLEEILPPTYTVIDEKDVEIDANSTYSDHFFVYPEFSCSYRLRIEALDPSTGTYVETDRKESFHVDVYDYISDWFTVDLMLPDKVVEGEETTISAVVKKANVEALPNVTVHLYRDSEYLGCAVTDYWGNASFKYTPKGKAGESEHISAEATTGGYTTHASAWLTISPPVTPEATRLTLTCPDTCISGEYFTVEVKLEDSKGNPLGYKKIKFYRDGVLEGEAWTDRWTGVAKYSFRCPTYESSVTIKAEFEGEAAYKASSDTCTVVRGTPTPTPTITPTPTPVPGPPPAPEAKFELTQVYFWYYHDTEYAQVDYDVENDEWKVADEVITEHLVPEGASGLTFEIHVKQTVSGAKAYCGVRIYDELNDEVLASEDSTVEVSGEWSFSKIYFYDGKERRIRIQVGAYEAGTWFKQDETEPLTLKGGKIAIEIKIKNVPEGVTPCVILSELSPAALLVSGVAPLLTPVKFGTRLFWTEDEIERDKTYYVYLGKKEVFLGLSEYCYACPGSIDSLKYTGTKIEKEYNWVEWAYMPSWMDDVCSALGITPICKDLWNLFSFFCGNIYIELFHKDPYTGEPVEPDVLTHVFCALDFLFFVPGEKIVGVVAQRGEALAKIAGTSGKVSDWVKSISKSRLIRGIASMSGETFEKKFLDKLAAGDTKAAEELLDSVLAAPEDTSVNIFKRIVDAIKNSRKTLKDAGRSVDEIDDMLSKSRLYAAHAEQTIEVAKDTLKGSWSDIRKLYDKFIAAWEGESPENIYRAVFEGRFASVEHPVTKEAVSAFMSDIQELAQAPKVKVLVEGVEKEVPVYFDDIFHAFFLKEKDCVKSLKDAGLLRDFLDELRVYVEARPKTYRGLIKQLTDDEFAAIVADLNAEGETAAANLFKQIREAADVIDEGKPGIKDAVKRVADAAEDLTADEKTRKAGAAVFEDVIDSVKASKEEEEAFKTVEEATDPEKNPLWKRFWDFIKSKAKEIRGKDWSLMKTVERLKTYMIITSPPCFALFIIEESLQRSGYTTKPLWDIHWGWEKKTIEERQAIIKDIEENLEWRHYFHDSLIVANIIASAICPYMAFFYFKYMEADAKDLESYERALEHLKKDINPVTGEGTCTLSVKCNVDGVHIFLDGVPTGKIAGRYPRKIYNVPVRSEEYELSVVGYKEGYLPAATIVTITPYDIGKTIDVYLELKEKSDLYTDVPETPTNPFVPQTLEPPTFDDMKKTPSPYGVAAPKGWWSGEVGDLYCNSYPPGAKILINGMDTGHVTPWTIRSLAEGVYHVTFQKEGYEDCEVVVEVKAGKTAQAYCDFTGKCPEPTSVTISYTPTSPTTDDTITFKGSAFAGEGHTIVSWDWDFGDGTTASGQTVTHKYAKAGSYQVTLIVKNDCGQTKSATRKITVSAPKTPTPPPCPSPKSVTISYSPDEPTVDDTITFTGSAVDGDGHLIVSWEWDFGDGVRAYSQTVTHKYSRAGSYKVRLKVTNDCGASATEERTLEVSEARCPRPYASISYRETTKPYVDQEVEFSAAGSTGGNTHSIISYEWDFGDGTTAEGVTVRHAWRSPGKYTVTLKVTNDCYATDTDTVEITVRSIYDVCDLIRARGGVSEITSVDIQQLILAFNGIIDYYFTVSRDAIHGAVAYYRGDIDEGDRLTGCRFAGFLRLWRLFEKMRKKW